MTLPPAKTVTESEAALVSACQRFVNDYCPAVFLEVIGQRKAKGSGTSKGATDLLLHVRGRTLVIEAKSESGRLNTAQVIARAEREKAGVTTYVIRDVQEFADICQGRKGRVRG